MEAAVCAWYIFSYCRRQAYVSAVSPLSAPPDTSRCTGASSSARLRPDPSLACAGTSPEACGSVAPQSALSSVSVNVTSPDISRRRPSHSHHPISMPTILLLGPRSSGKSSIADHLVQSESFQRVKIASAPTDDSLHFDNAADFLDYATLNWRSRFVCSSVRERKELDAFIKRPWVLVVGCEAGVTWRWQRCNEK